MSQQVIEPGKGSRLRVWGKRVAIGVVVIGVGIQFIPVSAMENPPEKPPLPEKPEIVAILKRSCYDCHSHEVVWPWYSRIAPVSWLVARDVIEGRKGINFSEWPEDDDDRQFNREAVWDSVKDGSMPLWFYTPMHPEAVLSDADKATLKAWAEASAEDEEEEGEDKAEGKAKDEEEDEDDEKAEGKDEKSKDDKAGAKEEEEEEK